MGLGPVESIGNASAVTVASPNGEYSISGEAVCVVYVRRALGSDQRPVSDFEQEVAARLTWSFLTEGQRGHLVRRQLGRLV